MIGYPPSEAARRSGFSLDTLRYYEKIGLLSDVARTSGGRRVFTDEDLSWLGLFRCLRDTGMPIAEMCRYAERVEEQMRLLQHQYDHLREKIRYYDTLA
ncbi:MerR family transcriptional regulator [Micromonospora olivasterospora]|uniref:DNA-binding transcriptional MerR regulator n=1 Tax=Micromonospora olivasterospora TaxID=1880 RepID=A0A562I436_MICOL|nr:MerR family transcriptional regulator [Micromonospora olivasterospora]TWH65799.1 DNA-binding transcriptional MerR regulator [Micromonospora olivasterospora]